MLFDRQRGRQVGEVPVEGVRLLRFLADGNLLVAATGTLSCSIYPVSAGAGGVRIGQPKTFPLAKPTQEADARDGILGVWDGQEIKTYSLAGRELSSCAATLPGGVHLRLAPGGRHASLATFKGSMVAVWDLRSGAKVFECPAWQKFAMTGFSPDGRLFVVARRDEHHEFETGTWRQVAAIPRRRIDGVPVSCCFSPVG